MAAVSAESALAKTKVKQVSATTEFAEQQTWSWGGGGLFYDVEVRSSITVQGRGACLLNRTVELIRASTPDSPIGSARTTANGSFAVEGYVGAPQDVHLRVAERTVFLGSKKRGKKLVRVKCGPAVSLAHPTPPPPPAKPLGP